MPPWLLAVVVTWSLFWKGLALWKSARRNKSLWFVVLLVVNTIGILEILYIFLFSEMKFDEKKQPKKKLHKPLRRQKALLE